MKSKNPHTLLVKQLESALKLRSEHFFCWLNNTGEAFIGPRRVKFGLKGSPDIIGFSSDGKFIGFEIKTGEARQTYDQKMFQEQVKKKGGRYFLVRNLTDTLSELDELFP